MNTKVLFILLVILGYFSNVAFATPETITIYSYHNHPPFVTGENKGLTYELADRLNGQATGKFQFQVRIIPRGRLNHYLKDWIAGSCPGPSCRQDWIVPWVNPKWGFIKGKRDNYLWHALLSDANVIVSRKKDEWRYLTPESLTGRVLGGMLGHRYVGIDALVQAGEIKRIDGNRERDNLLKVLHKRVDATLLPESTINYLLQNDPEIQRHADDFRVAEQKHQSYMRYIMLPEQRRDLFEVLDTVEQGSLHILDNQSQ